MSYRSLYTITDICSCLSVRKTVYVRKVASLVGQIISTYSVIGNIVYYNMQKLIRKVMQEICKIYVLHLLTRKTPNIQYGDTKCQHDDMLSEYRT
jgi:hypothetical protein